LHRGLELSGVSPLVEGERLMYEKVMLTIDMAEQFQLAVIREFYRELRRYL
jgi:hypothetical protein